MNSAAEIEAAAALWLSRREDVDWTPEDQAALNAWLEQSVAHKMAFWRLEFGWGRADRMAALADGAAPSPVTPPRLSRFARPAAIAAGLAFAAVIAAPLLFELGPPEKRYETELGARASVPLRDGTRVELNTATRLRADLDGPTRQVWLDRGEAYFDVAHDAARLFVVHAGDRRVTVLGTRFAVRRDGARVEIAVAEGRVRVEVERAAAAAPPAVLLGGDRIVAEGRSTLRAPRSVEKVSEDLAWRDGALSFEQAPLSEVAQEFNRYNEVKLSIAEPVASRIHVDGRFEASNVEAFARLMQRGYGLKISRTDRAITISE